MGKYNYNFYNDEDYSSYDEYKKERDKKKNKGHQSRHQSQPYWDNIDNDNDNDNDYSSDFTIKSKTEKNMNNIVYNNKNKIKNNGIEESLGNSNSFSITSSNISSNFNFGPNTHEVKGNMIDFDRVMDIQKIENEHNGRNTFGIKFLFLGKKGLYRIAWFNSNERERDRIYEAEKEYWMNLESYLTRSKKPL